MAEYHDADDSDHSSSTIACACGQTAHYAGRRPKTFTTLLGPLTLHRAYYHCAACRRGSYPRDQALGLQDTSLSPAAARLVGLAATSVSFAEASEWMGELAGVAVDPKQVERIAEALGREVAADERERVEPAPGAASTMYLGLDGTGVPVRKSEVEGRRGKQPDGSAKTREVKLVTVWTAETRNADGLPERDPGSVSYSAAVESAASRPTDPLPSPFAQRAYREARRRGFDTAARRVVIGDGAEWIWNLAAEQFPGAIEIVDIYHAKGHLCDVAKAIYGAGSDLAVRWGKDRRDELDAGRFDAILTELRAHSETCEEARKCIDYLTRNRHRMRYPEFRPVGSLRVVGRRRGRMQARHRRPAQARRHALDTWPAPTPSSPCGAASSVAASRTSGNDEPPGPPDSHLTNLTCTLPPGVHDKKVGDFAVGGIGRALIDRLLG